MFYDALLSLSKRLVRPIIDARHFLYPFFGALRYALPSHKLVMIGITGTDGKSSSVLMIARILQAAGHKTGFFSSIVYGDGTNEFPNSMKMTTPGKFFLQKFLRECIKNGATHCVLEITSEGIKQYRDRCIQFNVVGITNITPEHIESHGSFVRYKQSKLSFARRVRRNHKSQKILVMSGDDPELPSSSVLQNGMRLSRCSFHDATATVHGVLIRNDLYTSAMRVSVGDEQEAISLPLGGPFVCKNALFSIAVTYALGIPLSTAKVALERLRFIPGRFEIMSKSPLVIIDYAHTIAALKQLLPYVRARCSGKIIHVFGAAGGGRDKWKRPQLARLSEAYADISILTEENPFDENPQQIIDEIKAGFSDKHQVIQGPMREHAVRKALTLASANDAVLLTAKGAETVIAGPRGTKRPYHERVFVSCYLSKQSYNA